MYLFTWSELFIWKKDILILDIGTATQSQGSLNIEIEISLNKMNELEERILEYAVIAFISRNWINKNSSNQSLHKSAWRITQHATGGTSQCHRNCSLRFSYSLTHSVNSMGPSWNQIPNLPKQPVAGWMAQNFFHLMTLKATSSNIEWPGMFFMDAISNN